MTPLKRTGTETAALELRKAIIRGELKSGDRLVPAKLEKEMGLNRISIREAIRELVGTGLVESATHKGAFIAEPLDINELREIFELRYHLEGRAAYVGAQHILESDIIRMELMLDKLEHAQSLYEGFFLNQEFHMILYRATGWQYLPKIIYRAFDQVLVFRSSVFHRLNDKMGVDPIDPSYLESYLRDHRQIIEHLKDRNPEEVRNKTVSHLKTLGFENIYQLYRDLINRETMEVVI